MWSGLEVPEWATESRCSATWKPSSRDGSLLALGAGPREKTTSVRVILSPGCSSEALKLHQISGFVSQLLDKLLNFLTSSSRSLCLGSQGRDRRRSAQFRQRVHSCKVGTSNLPHDPCLALFNNAALFVLV
eukprot:5624908-Amphidinium_carterae.2